MIKIANNLKYMLAEKAPSNSDKPAKEELVGDQEKLDINILQDLVMRLRKKVRI